MKHSSILAPVTAHWVKQTGRSYIFKMVSNNYDDYDKTYYNSVMLNSIITIARLHITWLPGIQHDYLALRTCRSPPPSTGRTWNMTYTARFQEIGLYHMEILRLLRFLGVMCCLLLIKYSNEQGKPAASYRPTNLNEKIMAHISIFTQRNLSL